MTQTILITGSSSGIGKETAKYFAEKGWNVAATMRTPNPEHELTRYANVRIYTLDVTDTNSIQTAINATIQDFGTIHVLVNNAGYGTDGIFEATSDDAIQHEFDTNVFGLMKVTRAILPHMREHGGTIVQVASMGGRVTFPLYSVYHATKWAVEGFSESLQYELRQFNIRIKIVEPGTIQTEFYGRNRKAISSENYPMYEGFVKQCRSLSEQAGRQGSSPRIVAEKIYQSVTDTSWRMRYASGYPAPLLLTLRKLIPEAWFFRMLRMVYRI